MIDLDGDLISGVNLQLEMIKSRGLQFRLRRSKFLDRGSFNSVNQDMNVSNIENAGIIFLFPKMEPLFRAGTIIDQ